MPVNYSVGRGKVPAVSTCLSFFHIVLAETFFQVFIESRRTRKATTLNTFRFCKPILEVFIPGQGPRTFTSVKDIDTAKVRLSWSAEEQSAEDWTRRALSIPSHNSIY